MNAVVVHYKELALKGKNRPWFIQVLVRNLKTALAGLHVRAVRSSHGPASRSSWVADDAVAGGAGAVARASSGSRTSSMAGRGPHDFDALAAAILATSATVDAVVVPRVGDARRQAAAVHLAADRARSRRAHQGSEGLARRSRPSGADDPHRDAAGRRVLFLRQGAGRRRSADRDGRTRRVPAVGRHRFAGCGVPA